MKVVCTREQPEKGIKFEQTIYDVDTIKEERRVCAQQVAEADVRELYYSVLLLFRQDEKIAEINVDHWDKIAWKVEKSFVN